MELPCSHASHAIGAECRRTVANHFPVSLSFSETLVVVLYAVVSSRAVPRRAVLCLLPSLQEIVARFCLAPDKVLFSSNNRSPGPIASSGPRAGVFRDD